VAFQQILSVSYGFQFKKFNLIPVISVKELALEEFGCGCIMLSPV